MQDSFSTNSNINKARTGKDSQQTVRKPLQSSTYISRKEAAKRLNVCTDTLTRYAENRLIPFMMVGGQYLFIEDDIDKFDVSTIKHKHLNHSTEARIYKLN